MWAAIRDALRALQSMWASTVSGFASALWWLDERATSIWNGWSRLVNGTAYRPAPVHDVQDSVDAIVERVPEPPSPVEDMAERGALVRRAAASILCGDRDAGQDLPSDVRLWLLALAKPDLRTVLAATVEQIGRHASGHQCIKGTCGRPVPVPNVERDLAAIRLREEALTRGISMQEKAYLEDLLAVRATRRIEEADEPDEIEPAVGMTPRLV